MTKGHNIWDFTERLFVTSGTYNSLWPKTICCRWSLQFAMSKCNNNWDVTNILFTASGCYRSLRGYSAFFANFFNLFSSKMTFLPFLHLKLTKHQRKNPKKMVTGNSNEGPLDNESVGPAMAFLMPGFGIISIIWVARYHFLSFFFLWCWNNFKFKKW